MHHRQDASLSPPTKFTVKIYFYTVFPTFIYSFEYMPTIQGRMSSGAIKYLIKFDLSSPLHSDKQGGGDEIYIVIPRSWKL